MIEVLRTLDGDELEPDTLTVREPSMDDVFLKLTGHHAEHVAEAEPRAGVSTAGRREEPHELTVAPHRRTPARPGASRSAPVRDTLAIAQRNLIAYRRVPQLLVFSTIQPVIFVLMFTYVFGGAIRLPPGSRTPTSTT